jgi:hypothetical protein
VKKDWINDVLKLLSMQLEIVMLIVVGYTSETNKKANRKNRYRKPNLIRNIPSITKAQPIRIKDIIYYKIKSRDTQEKYQNNK